MYVFISRDALPRLLPSSETSRLFLLILEIVTLYHCRPEACWNTMRHNPLPQQVLILVRFSEFCDW